jgi:hypothetical protein
MLRDLFSLRVDMVFYDLTSTYFEGSGPPEMGAHGHSRDGKPRNPQVLVGLVMVEGRQDSILVLAGSVDPAGLALAYIIGLNQFFSRTLLCAH